jgi:hypothetical protein
VANEVVVEVVMSSGRADAAAAMVVVSTATEAALTAVAAVVGVAELAVGGGIKVDEVEINVAVVVEVGIGAEVAALACEARSEPVGAICREVEAGTGTGIAWEIPTVS